MSACVYFYVLHREFRNLASKLSNKLLFSNYKNVVFFNTYIHLNYVKLKIKKKRRITRVLSFLFFFFVFTNREKEGKSAHFNKNFFHEIFIFISS